MTTFLFLTYTGFCVTRLKNCVCYTSFCILTQVPELPLLVLEVEKRFLGQNGVEFQEKLIKIIKMYKALQVRTCTHFLCVRI